MRQQRRHRERERLKQRGGQPPWERFPRWLLWTVVGLVGAGGLVAIVLAASGVFGGASTPDYAFSPLEVAQLASTGQGKGLPNAPVTIIEFSDFQCPFCKRFRQGPLPVIEREFVASNRARLVYRHMAFIGEESVLAAEASECAADQGRFWDYHDRLFQEQGPENVGTFTPENLTRFATELGLDGEQFAGCLESQQHREEVKQSTLEAQRIGIRGTPTVFVNGRFIQDTRTADEMRQVILDELERAAQVP